MQEMDQGQMLLKEVTEEAETKEQEELEIKEQYLIFIVDDEYFGIDINGVIEIISMEPITIVPDLPSYIKGVINLRGKIIPVMDVRIRFGKETEVYTDRTCIIVVEIGHTYMGLIVDQVVEVMDIKDDIIMQPPKSGKEKDNITNRYIFGLAKKGDKVRMLIDGKKLLEKEEN